MRRQYYPLAELAQPKAKINIVEIYREKHFVHPPDGEVIGTSCEEARPSNGAALVSNQEKVGVARIRCEPVVERVSRGEVGAQNDSTVLDHAARPLQESAYGSNCWIQNPRQHLG
jgi:hypothetical protein